MTARLRCCGATITWSSSHKPPLITTTMRESVTMREIWTDLSRGTRRLFRNNVGTGWAGGGQGRKAIRVTHLNLAMARAALREGDVVVPGGRPLHCGLREGSADCIGWESLEIEITPAMLGLTLKVAVFLSVESKSSGGRLSATQRNWQQQVQGAGGIAIVARSAEEARAAIEVARAALLQPLAGS